MSPSLSLPNETYGLWTDPKARRNFPLRTLNDPDLAHLRRGEFVVRVFLALSTSDPCGKDGLGADEEVFRLNAQGGPAPMQDHSPFGRGASRQLEG